MITWLPVEDGEYMNDDPNGPIHVIGNGDLEACPYIMGPNDEVLLEPGMAICRATERVVVEMTPERVEILRNVLNLCRIAMWNDAALAIHAMLDEATAPPTGG